MKTHNNESGFTLVELMVALAISGIVISSIYTVFTSQQNSYYAQDQTAKMQQNIRGGMNLLTREVMIAGYDLTSTAGAGITVATNNILRFTLDLDDDGDVTGPGEDIRYDRYQNGDGIWCLGRSVQNAARDSVAENIEQLEFYYTMEDGSQTLAPGNLDNIRNVQISILSRAATFDTKFTNTKNYVSASGAIWPANDNFRRRLLITTIQIRNMGL